MSSSTKQNSSSASASVANGNGTEKSLEKSSTGKAIEKLGEGWSALGKKELNDLKALTEVKQSISFKGGKPFVRDLPRFIGMTPGNLPNGFSNVKEIFHQIVLSVCGEPGKKHLIAITGEATTDKKGSPIDWNLIIFRAPFPGNDGSNLVYVVAVDPAFDGAKLLENAVSKNNQLLLEEVKAPRKEKPSGKDQEVDAEDGPDDVVEDDEEKGEVERVRGSLVFLVEANSLFSRGEIATTMQTRFNGKEQVKNMIFRTKTPVLKTKSVNLPISLPFEWIKDQSLPKEIVTDRSDSYVTRLGATKSETSRLEMFRDNATKVFNGVMSSFSRCLQPPNRFNIVPVYVEQTSEKYFFAVPLFDSETGDLSCTVLAVVREDEDQGSNILVPLYMIEARFLVSLSYLTDVPPFWAVRAIARFQEERAEERKAEMETANNTRPAQQNRQQQQPQKPRQQGSENEFDNKKKNNNQHRPGQRRQEASDDEAETKIKNTVQKKFEGKNKPNAPRQARDDDYDDGTN